METLQALFVEFSVVIAAVSTVLNGLLAIAAVTPTEADDKILGRAKNLLDKVLPFAKKK